MKLFNLLDHNENVVLKNVSQETLDHFLSDKDSSLFLIEELHDYTVELYHSDYDPRGDDNLGTMICFHGNYNLGDNHDYSTKDFNGWEDMKDKLIRTKDVAIILPLYLYDHSGITMKTSPFSCQWDSGQVGYIFVTRAELRENFQVKRLSDKLIEKGTRILEAEVEEYDQCLRGEIYGFTINDFEEHEDSCGGFFGTDWKTNGILDHIDFEKYGWTEEETIEKLDEALNNI